MNQTCHRLLEEYSDVKSDFTDYIEDLYENQEEKTFLLSKVKNLTEQFVNSDATKQDLCDMFLKRFGKQVRQLTPPPEGEQMNTETSVVAKKRKLSVAKERESLKKGKSAKKRKPEDAATDQSQGDDEVEEAALEVIGVLGEEYRYSDSRQAYFVFSEHHWHQDKNNRHLTTRLKHWVIPANIEFKNKKFCRDHPAQVAQYVFERVGILHKFSRFEENLEKNPTRFIAFPNGVIDLSNLPNNLETISLRDGKPEDYIS